jgi:hypothetical protein
MYRPHVKTTAYCGRARTPQGNVAMLCFFHRRSRSLVRAECLTNECHSNAATGLSSSLSLVADAIYEYINKTKQKTT